MENVHLHGFHAVDISADDVKWEEWRAESIINPRHWKRGRS